VFFFQNHALAKTATNEDTQSTEIAADACKTVGAPEYILKWEISVQINAKKILYYDMTLEKLQN